MHSCTPEGACNPNILEYLRAVEKSGIPSRTPNRPQARVRAEAHKSAKERVDEVLHKIFKIASKGRIILCTSEAEPYLEGVISTPMGMVPKKLPDQTVSPDGRMIHDQRFPINELGSKHDHPPAKQPVHAQVARTILYLKGRFPGIPVFLSKIDVDAAFQNLPVAEDDVCEFATEIPADRLGLDGQVVALYLCLSFGWVGSPGEYQIWGTAAQQFFQAHAPEKPLFNGTHPFANLVLVDDHIHIEVDVGIRKTLSTRLGIESIRLFLGEQAINMDKWGEEGEWSLAKIIWGLLYDAEKCTVALPAPKLVKAAVILSDPNLDAPLDQLLIHTLQILRGNGTYWATVQPMIAPELGVVDKLCLLYTSPSPRDGLLSRMPSSA